jgi:hypothetical protein
MLFPATGVLSMPKSNRVTGIPEGSATSGRGRRKRAPGSELFVILFSLFIIAEQVSIS